jgi:hypothetical protein
MAPKPAPAVPDVEKPSRIARVISLMPGPLSSASISTALRGPNTKYPARVAGIAPDKGASACRLVRVAGSAAAAISRGEAALADEGTGTENGSLRRHGALS